METITTIKIDSPVPKKPRSGIFISTCGLVTAIVVTAALLAGSILATYFGRKCDNDSSLSSQILVSKCADVFCANRSLVTGKLLFVS